MESQGNFSALPCTHESAPHGHGAVMTLTVFSTLLYFLFLVLVRSAPLDSVSTGFWEEAERAKALVEKILKEIPVVHATTVSAQGLTLESSNQETQLQMMMTSLGIPAAPILKPLSERFSVDMCTRRMWIGGQLHQRLLGVLSERLSGLTDLSVDLRDLLSHIIKIREGAKLGSDLLDQDQDQTVDPGLSSRLHGNYELQVAAHVTLLQLRSFCHDMIRSLRALATYRQSLATAH